MKTKWLWIGCLLAFVIAGVGIVFLPEEIPMHYDFYGSVDRFGSKYELLLFPVFIMVFIFGMSMYEKHLLMRLQKCKDEEKKELMKSKKQTFIVSLIFTIFFNIILVYAMYLAYESEYTNVQVYNMFESKNLIILISVCCIVMGSVMPRFKRNPWVGIGMNMSLYNANTRYKSNIFSGYVLVVFGIWMIIWSIFISAITLILLFIISLLICIIVMYIYAYRVYKAEVQKEE